MRKFSGPLIQTSSWSNEMERLSKRDRELAAIGAAIASNCIPCIEYHIPQARKAGLSDAQILEAVRLADKVRQVPARKVLQAASALLGQEADSKPVGGSCESASASGDEGTPCCEQD
jgi:4-carboxymuconolactone decarboxylase